MGISGEIIRFVLTIAVIAAAPFLLLWIARLYFDVIEPYRKRTSHLVRYFGGREPGDGMTVAYYERDKELHFFGDDEERIFYIPDEGLWNQTMPEFFKGRQALVVQRIRRRIPRRVALKFVDTYAAAGFILYVDQSKTGPEKAVHVGKAA